MLFNRLSLTFQMPETGRRGRKVTKNPPNVRPSQLPFLRLSKMQVTKLRWNQTDGLRGMCGWSDSTSGGRTSLVIEGGADSRVSYSVAVLLSGLSAVNWGYHRMRLQGTISFEMPASFAPLSASLRHDSIFRPAPPSYFEPAANSSSRSTSPLRS